MNPIAWLTNLKNKFFTKKKIYIVTLEFRLFSIATPERIQVTVNTRNIDRALSKLVDKILSQKTMTLTANDGGVLSIRTENIKAILTTYEEYTSISC